MKLGNTEIPDDLYVVLLENDAGINGVYASRGEPICWEIPLKRATLNEARITQKRVGSMYGATRIAKLTVIEE